MRRLAIIPARGGSKRIPQKNIRSFLGKPILAYSIEAARRSGCFQEVMVSTDSEEIAAIAGKWGASVPFLRSAESSTDVATTADVISEVLESYRRAGEEFDSFACIYPTAPLLTHRRLVEAVELLDGAEAVVSVVRYSFPPQRAFVIRNGGVVYQYPQYERTRSQDLEPIYHDCGQFYLCTCGAFWRYHTLIPPGTRPFLLPEEEVQDIDTFADWRIAEIKFQALHKKENGNVSDV